MVEKEKTRLRIRFSKCGDLRWISHRDLARLWERLLRRANLQMAFSEGFHPKPRISFPSALALGIEALEEVVELEVLGAFELGQIEEDIRKEMPIGMELIALESPDCGLGKAKLERAVYRIKIAEDVRSTLEQRIREIYNEGVIKVQRDENKQLQLDVAEDGFSMHVDGDVFEFSLPHTDGASIRPVELLGYVGLGDLLESGETLQRCSVVLREPVAKQAVDGNKEPGSSQELPSG